MGDHGNLAGTCPRSGGEARSPGSDGVGGGEGRGETRERGEEGAPVIRGGKPPQLQVRREPRFPRPRRKTGVRVSPSKNEANQEKSSHHMGTLHFVKEPFQIYSF